MTKFENDESSRKAFERAKTLLDWNIRVLSIAGLWPKINKILFLSQYYLFSYHLFKDFVDFYMTLSTHNLIRVIGTGMECISLIQVYFRFWTLKTYNKDLVTILNNFIKDYSINNYSSKEERKIFLNYNLKSKMCILINFWTLTFTIMLYYFQPLVRQLRKF